MTKNFCLKTDTVAVPVAKGSQEAVVIRTQWKQELDKVGLPVDCHISVTTDGASNFRSARNPGINSSLHYLL